MVYRTAALLAMLTALGRAAELPVCPPDWSIEIVATAPQIKHPSVVCSAPDGRVFAAEDPMDISAPRADLALGRILCFHPNGKITVFAEKLYAVFGMQYLEGKLYVLHNPKFSVFTDNDGVGTNRFELIESTNPNPWALDWNDHVPANFRLGMDGFFYVAVGDKGVYGAVGRDGKRVDLHGGGILRLRPDGTELEVFCTGVRNILDVAINEEDEIFTYDNTDEMGWMSRLTHMVEGGFYGYPYDFSPRRGYTLWMMADYGGGAATGTLCYNEDALPEKYRGNLWLADFGKRQILRVKVAREGATFRDVSREDVFSKVPGDFYPVGIAWGADAKSILICDWQHRDTKENVVAGRLWKMTYTGPSQAAPKPTWYLPAALGQRVSVRDEELTNALGHPSHSVRLTAQRRLSERGDAVIKLLGTVLQQTNSSPMAKWHAIWALDSIDQGRVAREEIINLVSHSEVSVARQAIRQLASRRVRQASIKLETAVKHSNATIRFHAATALGRISSPSSVEALMHALEESDAFAAYAAFTTLNRIGKSHPSLWEQIAVGLNSSSQVVRERTVYALRETYDAKLVSVLSKLANDATQPISARIAALQLLTGVYRKRPEWKGEWWAYHPVKSPPPDKSVEWEGTPVVLGSLRATLNSEDEALRLIAVEGLRQAKDMQSAGRLREMFAKEKNELLKGALVEAFAALRDTNAGPLLVEFLRQKNQPANLQQRAIEALGAMRFDPAGETLAHIATNSETNVGAAAIEALVSIGGDTALKLLERLTTMESRDLRSRAILALGSLKNRDTFPALLKAYDEPETRTAAIQALTQMPDLRALDAYLHGLADRNASLREKCRRALSTIHKEVWPTIEARISRLPSEAIAELQRVYKDFEPARRSQLFTLTSAVLEPAEYAESARRNSGDPEHGRKLFFDASGIACSKCHVVNGVGGTVGPDLSTVGSQFSREALIESVLYPSKAIREGYQQTVIELRNGDSLNGSIKGESADTVTIQDVDGRLHTLRKGQIAERNSSALSLMPEGLHSALTLAEFADLIAYLATLKGDSTQR